MTQGDGGNYGDMSMSQTDVRHSHCFQCSFIILRNHNNHPSPRPLYYLPAANKRSCVTAKITIKFMPTVLHFDEQLNLGRYYFLSVNVWLREHANPGQHLDPVSTDSISHKFFSFAKLKTTSMLHLKGVKTSASQKCLISVVYEQYMSTQTQNLILQSFRLLEALWRDILTSWAQVPFIFMNTYEDVWWWAHSFQWFHTVSLIYRWQQLAN